MTILFYFLTFWKMKQYITIYFNKFYPLISGVVLPLLLVCLSSLSQLTASTQQKLLCMIKHSWFPKGTELLNLIFSLGDNAFICVYLCVSVCLLCNDTNTVVLLLGQISKRHNFMTTPTDFQYLITRRWRKNTISKTPLIKILDSEELGSPVMPNRYIAALTCKMVITADDRALLYSFSH